MAEVAELRIPQEDALAEVVEIETLESVLSSSHHGSDREVIFHLDPDLDSDPISPRLAEFLPTDQSLHGEIEFEIERDDGINEPGACVEILSSDVSDADSIANSNENEFSGHDCQVSLVLDLFEGCSGRTYVVHNNDSSRNCFRDDSFFGVVDENNEMSSDYHEVGLGLGLGLGFNGMLDDDGGGDNGGFMMDECADEFFVGRRAESAESSARRSVEPFKEGLRVVGLDSDSDEEEEGVLGVDSRLGEDDELDHNPDDLGLPLCWDCLRLDDQRESNEDFEWEEVDERIDEGEVLSMVIDEDEERSISIQSEEVGEGREEAMRNLEWEVLLGVNNLERNHETDHDFDYIYPAEYEMLFGQFTENEISVRGSPPAAKAVVKNLPSIVLIQEDAHNEDALCAICKDEIFTEDQTKLLPCSHYYHGDCILPWLNIRNTCPVCRFELPTDDPAYEQRRAEREFHDMSRVPQTRLDFEIFIEP